MEKMGSFEGFCSGNGIAQLGKSFALEKLQLGEKVSYCSNFSEINDITAKSIAEYAREDAALTVAALNRKDCI